MMVVLDVLSLIFRAGFRVVKAACVEGTASQGTVDLSVGLTAGI